jgi:hypothetical protein
MVRFSKAVDDAIERAARSHGLDLGFLRTIAHIESSGNPKKVTGQYKGLFMLNAEGFRRHGGKGSIFDPIQNAHAGARKLLEDKRNFTKRHGREPTNQELYLAHQQGVSGSLAHIRHPDRLAWQSMHSTTEGSKRGAAWSKRAIWQNLTPAAKAKFKSVENVTSQDFIDFWRERFDKVAEMVA